MQVLPGENNLKGNASNRLQSIIAKAIGYGYLPRSFSTLDEIREDSDEKLFFLIQIHNPNHVLQLKKYRL